MTATQPGARGRPRDPGASPAIVAAALELLAERGMAGVTMRGIADRAGVGRQTIYRRWASKEALLADVFADIAEQESPLPDTGALRSDLVEYLTEVVAAFTSGTVGPALRALVAAGAADSRWTPLLHDVQARRRAITRGLVARAVARGELPADTDPDLLLDLLHGPLYLRLLVSGSEISAALVAPLVDAALATPPRLRR